jgi:calcineurin-like phosphoesterase family protein
MNRQEAVQYMNKLLVERWNECVDMDDQVYHLGDFAFSGTANTVSILKQLKGKKYLIRGNHDHKLCKTPILTDYFEWVKDYYVLRVHDKYANGIDDSEILQYHESIILCHFPILSWEGMHHGSWHLHGHCHGSLPPTPQKRLDVGVDTNHLRPYSYKDVKAIMQTRVFKPVDHHGIHS